MTRRTPGRPLAAAALALACASFLLPGCQREPRRPNILIVVLDTVRRDAAGWPTAVTPAGADRGRPDAERGRPGPATASPGAAPGPSRPGRCPRMPRCSRVCLPSGHGCNEQRPRLNSGLPTMAGRLADAGYQTAAFYSNPWLADRSTGLLRGFQLRREAAIGGLGRMIVGDSASDQGGAASVSGFGDWLSDRDPERPFLAFELVKLQEWIKHAGTEGRGDLRGARRRRQGRRHQADHRAR